MGSIVPNFGFNYPGILLFLNLAIVWGKARYEGREISNADDQIQKIHASYA